MRERVRGLIRLATPLLAVAAAISCGDGATEPREDRITVLRVGTPLSDVVERRGSKLYAVPVTVGVVYEISLTSLTDDVDLYLFGDDSTFTGPGLCLVDHTLFFGTASEDCAAVATADTMYIGVGAIDVAASTATYTIAVALAPVTSLTLSSPLEASIADGEGTIFTVGVTPGTAYSVSITGLTDSATAFHVLESGQGGSMVGAQSPMELRLTALGSTIYMAVEGSGLTQPTASLRILAAPAPVISGTIIPTSGPVPARTPVVGWVETRSTSRYRTDGLSPGAHTISIVGATGDVDLHVYPDDTYSLELDCTLRSFNARECTVTGTSVFFAVASGPLNRDGAGYIMLVW